LSNHQILKQFDKGEFPSWKNPNGIAFISSDQDRDYLSTIDSTLEVVSSMNTAVNYIYDPQFVSNSNVLAYCDNSNNIYFFNKDNEVTTSQNIGLSNFGISDNGKKILFGRGGKYIYVMNIDGANSRQIK